MNRTDPLDHGAGPKPPSKATAKDIIIPSSLKRKLEEESEKPAMRYRIKSVVAVKRTGLPIFNLNLESPEDVDEGAASLISGLTSALWLYASQATDQDIQELSLEDDKVFFLQESGAIIGVVAEKTVPIAVPRTIAQEVSDLLTSRFSAFLKLDVVDLSETPFLLKAVTEIVKSHAMTKPAEFRRFFLKVALIGDGGVGKTSLFNRFMGKEFEQDYLMTIGADIGKRKVQLLDQTEIKFLITDIAGQPHFSEVRKAYYRGVFGVLIVIDVTRPETFRNSIKWLNEAWTHGSGPFPVIFLGNKNDLRAKHAHCISHDRMQKLAQVLSREAQAYKGFRISYIPTSAKTGMNVDLAFRILGFEIVNWLIIHREKKRKSAD
ncbi:MAG: Rab family GTPase, partial [Candidatus Hodarchaeales archaeon]